MNTITKKAVATFRQELVATAGRFPKKGEYKISITQFIPRGKENRISSAELMRIAGIPDERTKRAIIHKARVEEHAPILATTGRGGGYYMPDEDPRKAKSELEEFIAVFSAIAKSIFAALKSARAALRTIENGEHIEH